jgi:hypothetical protein
MGLAAEQTPCPAQGQLGGLCAIIGAFAVLPVKGVR